MKIHKRLALLIGLFALFIIVTPMTILLSLGYRYDPSTGRLQRTGTLMVSSLPKQAEIFLNYKAITAATPATLRFLAPGEYDLRLQKTGYLAWEKHFTLLPNQLVKANPPDHPITLFRDHPLPTLVATSTLDIFKTVGTIFTLAATSTLYLQNLTTTERIATTIPLTAGDDQTIAAADPDWIIIKSAGAFFATAPALKLTVAISALQPDAVGVQPLDKNTLLILTKTNALLTYDIRAHALTISHRRVHAIAAAGSQSYFLSDSGLYSQNRASTTVEKLADQPAVPAAAKIITTRAGYIFALLDSNLYTLGKNLQLLTKDILDVQWDEELGGLLLWKANSVLFFDPRAGTGPETIIRSTSPISNPSLHKGDGVIFYKENNKLKSIELQFVIRRVITELLNFDTPVKKFIVDREGKTVYYLTPEKKLFKVEIR